MLTTTKGKALDLSGAFAFLLVAVLFATYGMPIFAASCFFGFLSFVFSWLAWRELESDDFHEYGDEASYRACRAACIVLALICAATFIAAVVVWVLS